MPISHNYLCQTDAPHVGRLFDRGSYVINTSLNTTPAPTLKVKMDKNPFYEFIPTVPECVDLKESTERCSEKFFSENCYINL